MSLKTAFKTTLFKLLESPHYTTIDGISMFETERIVSRPLLEKEPDVLHCRGDQEYEWFFRDQEVEVSEIGSYIAQTLNWPHGNTAKEVTITTLVTRAVAEADLDSKINGSKASLFKLIDIAEEIHIDGAFVIGWVGCGPDKTQRRIHFHSGSVVVSDQAVELDENGACYALPVDGGKPVVMEFLLAGRAMNADDSK